MTPQLTTTLQAGVPPWLATVAADMAIIVAILLFAVGTMMIQVWLERRIVARMQDRLGPNRVGPAGLLQSIADGVKMFTKEDIVPEAADRWVHMLAPAVTVAPVVLMLAVVPWGYGLAPTRFGSGVLFALAVSSISAIGLMMAGWSSSNKFALLGAMRAVAQLVSYEIPGVLSLLAAVLVAGTMDLQRMAELQTGIPLLGVSVGPLDWGLGWMVFTPVGLVGFIVFFICALAEGERTPFDIPEADSEIVAGHTTEYSGMKFALFYIGQYVLNFALALIAALVFLGGWQGPFVSWFASIGQPWAASVLSFVYLVVKAWALFFVMVWMRGALPRLRVDQLMDFAWKLLLPLALVNLLSAALWVALTQWGGAQGMGFVENTAPWLRQILAIVVTGLLSGGAFYWLLEIGRGEAELLSEAAGDPAPEGA